MFRQRLAGTVIVAAGLASILGPVPASARQTVLIGSIGMGYDYWERTYDDDAFMALLQNPDEGDRREWFIGPEIELQSKGIHDTLSLRYAPIIQYDDLIDTTKVDHYLTLTGERFVNKDWTVSLSDNYALTTDPGRYGTTFYSGGQTAGAGAAATAPAAMQQPQAEITQNLGRLRYWTNDLILGSTYSYAADSTVGGGYSYRLLRNDSLEQGQVGYDEFDRHDFSGSWYNRFNPTWRSGVELHYVEGLYDDREVPLPVEGTDSTILVTQSQDLEEYWADLQMEYDRGANDAYPLLYKYRGTNYDDFRPDIQIHEASLGWTHAFAARTRLSLAAGPSYVGSEDLDPEWGFNARAQFTKAYQHADLNALVSKSYLPRNFTGSNDSGVSDLTEARIDLTYRFTSVLTSTIFGLYRNEDLLNPQGVYFLAALDGKDPLTIDSVGDVVYTRDSYSAGGSIDYTFWRWFVATVRYEYYQQEGDLPQDSYNDHRVTLMLSASKELWR